MPLAQACSGLLRVHTTWLRQRVTCQHRPQPSDEHAFTPCPGHAHKHECWLGGPLQTKIWPGNVWRSPGATWGHSPLKVQAVWWNRWSGAEPDVFILTQAASEPSSDIHAPCSAPDCSAAVLSQMTSVSSAQQPACRKGLHPPRTCTTPACRPTAMLWLPLSTLGRRR